MINCKLIISKHVYKFDFYLKHVWSASQCSNLFFSGVKILDFLCFNIKCLEGLFWRKTNYILIWNSQLSKYLFKVDLVHYSIKCRDDALASYHRFECRLSPLFERIRINRLPLIMAVLRAFTQRPIQYFVQVLISKENIIIQIFF